MFSGRDRLGKASWSGEAAPISRRLRLVIFAVVMTYAGGSPQFLSLGLGCLTLCLG